MPDPRTSSGNNIVSVSVATPDAPEVEPVIIESPLSNVLYTLYSTKAG